MKITITPEKGEKGKKIVYNKVHEFALVATALRGDLIPHPINHTYGDTYVLFGKLEELKERLRKLHGVNSSTVS